MEQQRLPPDRPLIREQILSDQYFANYVQPAQSGLDVALPHLR
jgi:hypothetical protein